MADDLWTFLTTGTNAEAVGAVVAALVATGGLLAWFFARSRPAQPTVSAKTGGVAIGGNADGATITTNRVADGSQES